MKTQKMIATIGLILLSAAWISGCGSPRELTQLTPENKNWEQVPVPVDKEELLSPTDTAPDETYASELTQLTALADDLEEAQEIAELYGIELDSYSYGVASYRTDKDVTELINFGLENDYPTLAPNYTSELHSEQEAE